mmetsp:Transcript_97064/g.274328  ORF Transcript_97064/g.274328 Transcript_97064/m.274328 type:complete len:252 (+) Transcript_97064:239-994(+)
MATRRPPPMNVQVPGVSRKTTQTNSGPSNTSSNEIKPTSEPRMYFGPVTLHPRPMGRTTAPSMATGSQPVAPEIGSHAEPSSPRDSHAPMKAEMSEDNTAAGTRLTFGLTIPAWRATVNCAASTKPPHSARTFPKSDSFPDGMPPAVPRNTSEMPPTPSTRAAMVCAGKRSPSNAYSSSAHHNGHVLFKISPLAAVVSVIASVNTASDTPSHSAAAKKWTPPALACAKYPRGPPYTTHRPMSVEINLNTNL